MEPVIPASSCGWEGIVVAVAAAVAVLWSFWLLDGGIC